MLLKCAGTGSSGNSYALISDSGEILLIECGVQWNKILKMIDYQTSSVVGCVASHAHGDHLCSYKDCLHYGIHIYTNDETSEHFEVISGEKMIGKPERIPFTVGSFKIIPFYLPHDNTPNFGFLIEHEEMGKLLYCTDYEYLPYSFKNMRINHFLLECNHLADMADKSEAKYEHSIRGHSELSTVKEIISVNKTPEMRNIILCHLSEGWSDEKRMKVEIQETAGKWVRVEVAHAGLELPLSRYPWEV